MGLYDEFAEEQSSRKKGSCQFAKIFDKMSGAEKEAVLKAFNDGIEASTIATVLQKRGYEVSAYSVRRHRRYDCSCEKWDIPEDIKLPTMYEVSKFTDEKAG